MEYQLLPFQKDHFKPIKHQIYWCGTGVGKTIMAHDRWVKLGKPSPVLILSKKKIIEQNNWQEMGFPDDTVYTNSHYSNIKKLFDIKFKHIIIDECHVIKNYKSKVSQSVVSLVNKTKASTSWLSATPTSNYLFDYYPFIAVNAIVSGKEVDKRYSIYQPKMYPYLKFPIKELVGYHDEQSLLHALDQRTFKLLSVDMDFETLNETIEFKQLPDVKKIIKDRVYNNEVLETPISVYNAVRQLKHMEKIKFIKELEHEQIIIFTNYVSEVEFLVEHLDDVAIIDGKNKISDIHFKVKYLIINYAAGAEGLNLQHCSCLIHFSPPTNYTHFKQACGRIGRVGQKASVIEIYTLLCNQIDKKISKSLQQKEDFNVKKFLDLGDF